MYNDFTPDYNFVGSDNLSPFEVWCQKVLPTIYDNSLSYYELLTKVVNYLNTTMQTVNELGKDVTELNKAYNQLVTYVNSFKDYAENRMDNQDTEIANLTSAWNEFQEEMQKVIDDIPNQVVTAVDNYTTTQTFTNKVKLAVDQSLQETGAIPEISEINTKIGTTTESKTVFQDLEEIKENVSNINIDGVDEISDKIGATNDTQASATDGSVMGKLNLLIQAGSGSGSTDVNVQTLTNNVGNTADTGGSTTTGTVFAKENKLISDVQSLDTKIGASDETGATTASGSVMGKLNNVVNVVNSLFDNKIGTATDTEGTTTSGTVMAKLNKVITDITSNVISTLTSITSKIGTTSDGSATTTTGSLMGKSNKILEDLTTVNDNISNIETGLVTMNKSKMWGNGSNLTTTAFGSKESVSVNGSGLALIEISTENMSNPTKYRVDGSDAQAFVGLGYYVILFNNSFEIINGSTVDHPTIVSYIPN